jgi:hypothetical protein
MGRFAARRSFDVRASTQKAVRWPEAARTDGLNQGFAACAKPFDCVPASSFLSGCAFFGEPESLSLESALATFL